jgi:beta-lactamase class A
MKKTTIAPGTSVNRKAWITLDILFLLLLICMSLGFSYYLAAKTSSAAGRQINVIPQSNGCAIDLIRENSHHGQLIDPLYLADVDAESPKFSSLKWDLSQIILDWEKNGSITSVSVYMRELNDAKWMSIDCEEPYLPGSLMKVPIMIYYLKQEQDHPGTLNTELVYKRPVHSFPSQAFRGDSIVPGRKYKISELLRYMIVESDNNATYVLTTNLHMDQYSLIFSDLEIPVYDPANTDYTISPRQYSKFLGILYNATYLDEKLSEYALQLLSKCKFKEGIVRDLPAGTLVAHKFGERGINYDMDFSESAIIYHASNPYLLTIMTKGKDVKLQTALISELSKEIFRKFGNI